MALPVQILSYDDLRQTAAEFARHYNARSLIPVPIERIVEFDFGIDICPEMSLQPVCDVDAMVNCKCTTIHVDAGVYLSGNDNRYRFSLAHELAHVILHRPVIDALPFKSMGEWKQVYLSIPEDDRNWIEWQAHALAGLMLVPDGQLEIEFKGFADAISEDRRKDSRLRDGLRHMVQTRVGQRFSVSRQVVEIRCNKNRLDL